MTSKLVLLLISSLTFVVCMKNTAYYLGMFKKGDFLMAKDRVFKPGGYAGYNVMKYGRIFPCPVTYFRISNRIDGMKKPRVTLIRGGLRKRYVVAKMVVYNSPIDVIAYVGCDGSGATSTTLGPTTMIPETTEAEAETETGETTPEDDETTTEETTTVEPGRR